MNTQKTLLILAIFSIFTIGTISAKAKPTNSFDDFVDSNIGITTAGEHGWLPVGGKPGNDAFYYYVKNQVADPKAPLFILVPSGSGKSVLTSYFTTWGPQIFKVHSNTLKVNHDAFNKYADLLMIDLPIGTGFSRYADVSQIPTTTKQKVEHFHTFINNFFDKHSSLSDREIYMVSELRGTQMTPLYTLKMVKHGIKVKGLISFSNLSNPWIDHLSYAPNLLYKRVIKKSSKSYKSLNKSAKFCNLFTVLGAPNAEHYCTTLNDAANIHALDMFSGQGVQAKFDPNTHCTRIERKFERWMNTERVQKYFGLRQKFWNVNPQVFQVITTNDNRTIASDAVISALLNRQVEVFVIVGSLERTANWIGNLMSATRLRWYGQKAFGDAKWTLWNRKNDLKQADG
jgi:serine carboxypeptidase-like clade 4